MMNFERLLADCMSAVKGYVRYKLPSVSDADDVLQDVCLTAFRKFDRLSDESRFKPWILAIARNKCADWFREQAKRCEIPLETISERIFTHGRMGISESTAVIDTLERLGDTDRQILYLYYFREMPQTDIARRLGIPLGTVKSRLYTAKTHFKEVYPMSKQTKWAGITKLPELLPDYTIVPSEHEPFAVRCEELMGWPIIPRVGVTLSWGLYDSPGHRRTEYTTMEVVGKAEIHGIEGVEIVAIQHDAEDYYRTGSVNEIERRFIAQLTDTHCRFLAESHPEGEIRKIYTFLDGDSFLDNWGFGKDNCGSEVNLSRKGFLCREGNVIQRENGHEALDIVGRYTVSIGAKAYDTICVMDCDCYNDAVASEQYVDQAGRTVLWRRFNRDDWAKGRYGRLWSDMLPTNERLVINGATYVHWYDCVTDYIF